MIFTVLEPLGITVRIYGTCAAPVTKSASYYSLVEHAESSRRTLVDMRRETCCDNELWPQLQCKDNNHANSSDRFFHITWSFFLYLLFFGVFCMSYTVCRKLKKCVEETEGQSVTLLFSNWFSDIRVNMFNAWDRVEGVRMTERQKTDGKNFFFILRSLAISLAVL